MVRYWFMCRSSRPGQLRRARGRVQGGGHRHVPVPDPKCKKIGNRLSAVYVFGEKKMVFEIEPTASAERAHRTHSATQSRIPHALAAQHTHIGTIHHATAKGATYIPRRIPGRLPEKLTEKLLLCM